MNSLQQTIMSASEIFYPAIMNVGLATASGHFGQHHAAMKDLHTVVYQACTLSDLAGREQTLEEIDRLSDGDMGSDICMFAAGAVPSVIKVIPFGDAIQDLLDREPRMADTWKEVAEMYSKDHAFSVVRSADKAMTERIQKVLADLMKKGADISTAERRIQEVGSEIEGFTRAYAETVYRTNLSTANSAGRFKQAASPAGAKVIGAFRYRAVGDRSTRPNHKAANGMIASQFDRIWDTFSTPMGYNCRCGLRMVTRMELKRRGLLKGNIVTNYYPVGFKYAFPDPGFGDGRPDRKLYRGVTGGR